ncbi:MAG: thioredoxin family protein [Candidatus Hodarchaeales archaeon]|jgi:hypothetical protein
MKIIQPDEFKEFFNKGKTLDEYIENIENEMHAKRYKRNYKRKTVIPQKIQEKLSNIPYPINIVIIGAEWCWDCQTQLGLIAKIAKTSDLIEVRFYKDDDYRELVWKINGGEKLPQVHFYSKDGYYVTTWIERPTMTHNLFADVKNEIGWDADKNEFLKIYRKRFLRFKDKIGEATVNEVFDIIMKVQAIFRASARLNKKTQAQII